MSVQLEIIATSVEDAVEAERGGADRIELVSTMEEGGLTPELHTVGDVLDKVSLPVHVMVRPHSRSFTYSPEDEAVMIESIRAIRSMGAAGTVIGALTAEGRVDIRLLRRVLAEAGSMSVTFHRAIDECLAPVEAALAVAELPGVDRILTSGGLADAWSGRQTIRQMMERMRPYGIRVMAGSGVTRDHVAELIRATGVRDVHMGSGVRVDGSFRTPVDSARVAAAKQAMWHR